MHSLSVMSKCCTLVQVASEASGPIAKKKTAPNPSFLKTITDLVSAYVYAESRGRVCGNSVETQPRLKHKGKLGDLFPTVQVCNRGCFSSHTGCNRSPL